MGAFHATENWKGGKWYWNFWKNFPENPEIVEFRVLRKKPLSNEFPKADDNDNDNDNDNENNEEEERNKDRENEHGTWTTYPLKTLCLSYHHAQTMTASLPQRFIDDLATIVISL